MSDFRDASVRERRAIAPKAGLNDAASLMWIGKTDKRPSILRHG